MSTLSARLILHRLAVRPPPSRQNVAGVVPTLGTNFHTSYMPLVATGCTGPLSCESGQTLSGQSRCLRSRQRRLQDLSGAGDGGGSESGRPRPDQTLLHLCPAGDAANPFINTNLTADCLNGVANATNPSACGHGMGGAPIAAGQTAVKVLTQPAPFQPAKLTVFVFEDDFPLNGEQDAGGGIDVLSPNEPGSGGLQHRPLRRCRRHR